MNRILAYLRDFKFLQELYNFLNQDKLRHNTKAYEQYGIRKSLFSSISSKDFGHLPKTLPWLDDVDEKKVMDKINSLSNVSDEIKNQLHHWREFGYITIPQFFPADVIDQINGEIGRLIEQKKINFNERKKIMQAFLYSEKINAVATNPSLVDLLSLILGKEILPFQTINFFYGSEQRPHSDSIHMSTYPIGNLIAVWIALEDVTDENGPLFYYPGSHRLPYPTNEQYNHGGTAFRIGSFANARYEDYASSQIEKNQYEKKVFYAKKGDVLIWHANLLHGGDCIKNKKKTRKSMVLHYFAEDVIKYHELTQRPALISNKKKYS